MVLSFPMWLVLCRQNSVARPATPRQAPGFVAVFSTVQAAAAFMIAEGKTSFAFRLIPQASIPALIDDLRRLGMHGFCIDPEPHVGGTKILFAEVEATAPVL